ncbi:MAG TPA: molybdopterin-dependent oxidoreductase [Thermoanaerobaculia bacterium]|jgi:DMSO/TMAO reductase YedYZ molybdopterin-dependent catalytic subunit
MAPPRKPRRRLRDIVAETDPPTELVPERALAARSRRDFLIFGAAAVAAAAGFWWLLPDGAAEGKLPEGAIHALDTAAARLGLTRDRREKFLNRASLTFDDDVAEALFSRGRKVRTYTKADIRPIRNNYNGATPNPDYLADWKLALSGLASGRAETLAIDDLKKFALHEQITRLVCVEGWSAVAWWGGLRFSDLLDAYPPAPGAKWAAIESAVNLDGDGNSDPYYVSIDLETARHEQTLLATHKDGRPLPVEHGAPLRLLAPMKLGLKNIKAITSIEYTAKQPDDYWAKRGYSKYDGL